MNRARALAEILIFEFDLSVENLDRLTKIIEDFQRSEIVPEIERPRDPDVSAAALDMANAMLMDIVAQLKRIKNTGYNGWVN